MQWHESASAAGPAPRIAALQRLRIRNFRNFPALECEFPSAGVLIIGPNGSGKTNLLEAVYYLEIFRSFRGAKDAELVRFGEDVFRIEAGIRTPERERELAAAYRKTGRRKRVEVDRAEPPRLSEAIGTLGAVVFGLDDVEIVGGSPSRRRRFLNILLSLVEPGYVEALQRYRGILSQRNEALRDGVDPAAVEAWTAGLVEAGARIMAARAGWVSDRAVAFRRYHQAIAGGPAGRIAYRPSVGEGEETGAAEAWRERFRGALRRTAGRERRRGVTVVGPHRDDVVFTGEVAGEEERDLRTYGSGGQQRTASLALRMVEADSLRDRRDREPVYLLDDVFAELDRDRSERLMRLLDEGRSGQVIVTAPKPADLGLRGGGLERWKIRDGRIFR